MLTKLTDWATKPLTKFVGVLLVLACFGIAMAAAKNYVDGLKTSRDEAIAKAGQLEADLAIAQSVNIDNQAAITRLTQLREHDSEVLARFSAVVTALNDGFAVQMAKLKKLENENAEVKKYLNAPVPPDLIRMLTPPQRAAQNGAGSQDQRGSGTPAGSVTDAVR